jgi:uncharacterized membrane protein YsdA (DUF1294 family)
MIDTLRRIGLYLGIALSVLAIYITSRQQLFDSGELSRRFFWYYLVAGLPLLSIATIFVFRGDKNKAIAGEWRVSEATLLNLSACGGWPGAWWSIRRFKHKSSKKTFLAGFACATFCHIVLLGIAADWIFWR